MNQAVKRSHAHGTPAPVFAVKVRITNYRPREQFPEKLPGGSDVLRRYGQKRIPVLEVLLKFSEQPILVRSYFGGRLQPSQFGLKIVALKLALAEPSNGRLLAAAVFDGSSEVRQLPVDLRYVALDRCTVGF
jgi:hypothetical protein